MKTNNYTKLLLAALTLLLMISLFFNLHDVLLAQAPIRALKSLLTNYVGKQVTLSYQKRESGVLKEINSDTITIVTEKKIHGESGGVPPVVSFVVPFEAIKMVLIVQQDGKQDGINIILGL